MNPSETQKLYKLIAADFKIVANKTGLWTKENCENHLHDIKIMLENDFLEKISLILDKPVGYPIKAKQYHIGTTSRTRNDRPGNIDWEEGDGDRLHVVVSYSKIWMSKLELEQFTFKKNNFKINWGPVNIDLNFPHLRGDITKMYSTGENGIDRKDFI